MTHLSLRVGGVPEHFNLPWHLACEQDLYADLNADVSFHEYGGGTGQLAEALSNGELDVAVLLLEGALQTILNGGSFRIVKLYTDTPLVWGIHVAGRGSLVSIDDAQGKRYAISRVGSGSHLIAIVDASERGWPTETMNFVNIGNLQGARESLAAGGSDVFFWEKFMTKPLVDSGELRHVADRVVPWPAFVIAVRNETLESAPRQLAAVLQRTAEWCGRFRNDPAAAHIISSRFDLQLDDTRQWLDQTQWNNNFDYPRQSFQTAFKYLKLLNLIEDDGAKCHDAWFQLE